MLSCRASNPGFPSSFSSLQYGKSGGKPEFEARYLGISLLCHSPLVGGLTGAGARITGAFGDVFAKLTFDNEFIDKRQQQKTKPPRLGMKLGGFAMVSIQQSGMDTTACFQSYS